MAKKLKKFLKKAGKAAAVAAALYGATKLGKRAKSKAVEATDDAGIHVRPNAFKDYGPYTHKRFDPTTVNPDFSLPGAKHGGRIGAKGGGIAKRGMGAAFKKGGTVKSMGIAKRGGGVAKR